MKTPQDYRNDADQSKSTTMALEDENTIDKNKLKLRLSIYKEEMGLILIILLSFVLVSGLAMIGFSIADYTMSMSLTSP